MKRSILVVGGLFIMMTVFVSSARAEFKDGKWSMTMVTKINMANMPPQMAAMMGNGITMTVSQCMTHQNPIPKQANGCQETHQINGDTVTFTSSCNRGSAQISSQGRMSYSGDAMTGHVDSHEIAGGRTIDSTVDINGKYEGPC